MSTPVKLDIVSGFLGSGKTTFIKKMFEACIKEGEKVVLIENEFGEIGIDGEFVRREGFEVYEISKGCICCTLKNDFTFTLSEIITKIKPDRIIMEPSGVFVTSEIFDILKLPEFSSNCTINNIITIVDSVNYLKQNSRYSFFFENQISNAQTVILSKSQLVSNEEVQKIKTKLSSINKKAVVLSNNWNDYVHEDMLNILHKDIKLYADELLTEFKCCSCSDHHVYNHSEHQHKHGGIELDTVGFKTNRIFTKEDLETILAKVVHGDFGRIIRGKGLLPSNQGFLEFNYVNDRFTINTVSSSNEGIACFIGEKPDKEKIKDLFK